MHSARRRSRIVGTIFSVTVDVLADVFFPFAASEDYPSSVAKAFADQIDQYPHLEGTVVVPNFTLEEWVELQQWYETTNDLNKLQQVFSLLVLQLSLSS